MHSEDKKIGFQELWNILYEEEFHKFFLGNKIVLAEENNSHINLTTVTKNPQKIFYLLCNYLLYCVFECQVSELKNGALADQFNAFSKMILSACFAKNEKEDGIVKNTHIKYHALLQILAKDIDKIIVEQSSLYSNVLFHTYAFWEKEEGKAQGKELQKLKPTYEELRNYRRECIEKIDRKIQEIKQRYDLLEELPSDWPDPYEILASYTLLLLIEYTYPDFLTKSKEKTRYSEVLAYRESIKKGIKEFFDRGYQSRVQLTNEEVMKAWSEEIKGIIDWCDDFSNKNPELQIGEIKVNFEKFQDERIDAYIRAYNIASEKEIRQIIEQMRAELEAFPEVQRKLDHMRKMAEDLKKNPTISQKFVNNMDEIAKTFTIGALKNETRRDD